jgi:hypothetical protein
VLQTVLRSRYVTGSQHWWQGRADGFAELLVSRVRLFLSLDKPSICLDAGEQRVSPFPAMPPKRRFSCRMRASTTRCRLLTSVHDDGTDSSTDGEIGGAARRSHARLFAYGFVELCQSRSSRSFFLTWGMQSRAVETTTTTTVKTSASRMHARAAAREGHGEAALRPVAVDELLFSPSFP